MKTVDVICPVYNEAQVIDQFYRVLQGELGKLKQYQCAIFFIVDPGNDNTLEILKKIAQTDRNVKIISMSSRFGHQMSLFAGIEHSKADIVITMDSDLQHPPSVISELLSNFEKGFDIVSTIRSQTDKISFTKRLGTMFFYWFLNRISEVPITENVSDFRLMSGRVAKIIASEFRERALFLRGIIQWVGFSHTFVTFVAPARFAGHSKFSSARLVSFALTGIVSSSRRPLRLLTLLGLGLISLSALAGSLILFVGGLQLFALGVVGEYVAAILEEVRGRPHYIIAEKINC